MISKHERRGGREGHNATNGRPELESRLRRHDDLDTGTLERHQHEGDTKQRLCTDLSLHEASASGGRGTRHLCRLAAHGKLGLRVASGLHVAELVRALLAEVIKAAGEHDLGFSAENIVAGDLERLECSGAAAES
jgi:hypothetical protein